MVIAALTAQQLEAQTKEAYTRQTKFLAMVAHELRNPLIPLRTAAELLNRALRDESLLAQLQAAIKRQVSLVSRLVDDLLDGSRVSAGKFRLECSMVEMAGILSLAVESCRPGVEARSHRLTIHLAPAPLLVLGDPGRLGQIFSNLLDNASKYTAKGGEISLTVVVRDRALQITVSDNGIGITADALPNIFELFVQDARALTPYDGGLASGSQSFAIWSKRMEAPLSPGAPAATSAATLSSRYRWPPDGFQPSPHETVCADRRGPLRIRRFSRSVARRALTRCSLRIRQINP